MSDYLEDQEDMKREREMALSDEKLQPDLELLYGLISEALKDTGYRANREIRNLKKEVAELKSLILTLIGNPSPHNRRDRHTRREISSGK